MAIARALYFHAELIILDEPTMGLSITEGDRARAELHAFDQGAGQVGYLHRPQHLPRLLGGRPDRRSRSGGGASPANADLALLIEELVYGIIAKVGIGRHLPRGPSAIAPPVAARLRPDLDEAAP